MNGTFESTPAANTDGVLTACAGSQISITCRHSNLNSGITSWNFSLPVDCIVAIQHDPPSSEPCGPFSFQDVTMLAVGAVLSSTAVATANTSMTGTVVSCQDGAGLIPTTIGSITVCIIGMLYYTG